eukprot:751079_1
MYEFSESVIFDNGIGYIRNKTNVMCNMNKYIKYVTTTNATSANIEGLIKNEYDVDSKDLPCSDVTVKCGGPDENPYRCIMSYDIVSNTLQSLNDLNETSDFCAYVNIQ